MSKWSTRWALGLSTSVPVIEFEGKNMFLVDDICTLVLLAFVSPRLERPVSKWQRIGYALKSHPLRR
jgi:hypothetical protein